VLEAVAAVNGELADMLWASTRPNRSPSTPLMIEIDGTPNKGRLGANAILGVSLAVAKAAADFTAAALPLCRRNLGPGPAGADDEHHQWRRARRQPDRHPGIHDHAGGRRPIAEAVRMGAEIFHTLKKELKAQGLSTGIGDEGGFAPPR
jgi:enolase